MLHAEYKASNALLLTVFFRIKFTGSIPGNVFTPINPLQKKTAWVI